MSTTRRALSSINTKIIILLLLLLLTTAIVSAHRFGGKFPHTAGTYLYLGWTHSGSYRTQVVNGASSWTSTPTKLILFEEGISSSELDFYGYAYNATWWGLAEHHPCIGCTYTYANLYLNTNTLGRESDFTRQKVATHEAGHGFDLAHPGSGFTSIMNQGYLSYNTPQQHDINDTNSIYP